MTDESMEDRLRRMEAKPSEADAPQENPLELLAMYKKELDAYKFELAKVKAENEAYRQKEQLAGKAGNLGIIDGIAGVGALFHDLIAYSAQYAACAAGVVAGAYYLDTTPVVAGAASGAVVTAVGLVNEGDNLDIPDLIVYLCYGALGGAAVGYGAATMGTASFRTIETAGKLIAGSIGGSFGGFLGALARKIHKDIL